MIKLTKIDTGLQKASATLTLPYEKRIKSRLKVTLDNGTPAGLFLERGKIIRSGDRLVSNDGFVVEVISADEAVSMAKARDCGMLCRACYHLGNRHVPLQIGEMWVRYRRDHVLDRIAEHLGLTLSAELAPFEPENGAWEHHHHD